MCKRAANFCLKKIVNCVATLKIPARSSFGLKLSGCKKLCPISNFVVDIYANLTPKSTF